MSRPNEESFLASFLMGLSGRRQAQREARALQAAKKAEEKAEAQAQRRASLAAAGGSRVRAFWRWATEDGAEGSERLKLLAIGSCALLTAAITGLAAIPALNWAPDWLADYARGGLELGEKMWGGFPVNPPPQMRALRCANGVFAEGAPDCVGPAQAAGMAQGWVERARAAERGVFAPSDSERTRRDLLATRGGDKSWVGRLSAAATPMCGAAIAAGMAMVFVMSFWSVARSLRPSGAGPDLFDAAACALVAVVALSWLLGVALEKGAGFKAPFSTSEMQAFCPKSCWSNTAQGQELALRERTPTAMKEALAKEQRPRPFVLAFGPAKEISAPNPKDVARQATLGSWSVDEMESARLGELLSQKAPRLAPDDRARALWLLATRQGNETSQLNRLFQGGLVMIMTGAALVALFCVYVSVHLTIKKVSAKAQAIAKEGEAMARAQREKAQLVVEADMAAEKKSSKKSPPGEERARTAKRL
jgi:hypothetical protein